jgi:hypothetical protein
MIDRSFEASLTYPINVSRTIVSYQTLGLMIRNAYVIGIRAGNHLKGLLSPPSHHNQKNYH